MFSRFLSPFLSSPSEASEREQGYSITLPGVDGAVSLTLRRGTSRRRRFSIRVTRTGAVEVLLPPRGRIEEALSLVHRRATWIAGHVARARSRPIMPALRYVPGEFHFYLGQSFPLEIVTGSEAGHRRQVVIENSTLRICLPGGASEDAAKVLETWYRREAVRIFTQRLEALCAPLPWLSGMPELRVRAMQRRWGSCTYDGRLTLNSHLIKAPLSCIDYVLLHELAHLREMNHGPRYYQVLGHIAPNWKMQRHELEKWEPLILPGGKKE